MNRATIFWSKNLKFWLYIYKINYQFPVFAMEIQNTKHQTNLLKIFWNETNHKCERPQVKGNKPWMKINPSTHEKYPVSINLLQSLRKFHIAIIQHQVLPRLVYFQSFRRVVGNKYVRSPKNSSVMSELQLKLQ